MTILSRLVDLHSQLDAAGELEASGFAKVKIGYVVVLDATGAMVEVEETRSLVTRGKKAYPVANEYVLPAPVKRSVQIVPDLLWGSIEYALGIGREPGPVSPKVHLRHTAFRAEVERLAAAIPDDEGLAALVSFLAAHDPEAFAVGPEGAKIEDRTLSVSFRLDGEHRLIAQRPAVRAYLLDPGEPNAASAITGQCLVTGEFEALARLHPQIKGVAGAQPTGAVLISCNLSAFESYGLTQGYASPIGRGTASSIGVALNWLLRSGSPHKLRLGEAATTVMWATDDTPIENLAAALFEDEETPGGGKSDRLHLIQSIRDTLTAPRRGTAPDLADTRCCVLTLAPNNSRLAVAGWQELPLAEAAGAILQWYEDLNVPLPRGGSAYPAIPTLLRSIALMGELERIPVRQADALFRAALSGGRLPAEMLAAALGRLRADRVDSKVPHDAMRRARQDACRLAIIKACLIRNHQWSVAVALDPESADVAYRLGRLFAWLEKAQANAVKNANTTLADQYFSSASSMPGRILPVLLGRFHRAHKRRMEGNLGHWFDARILEVLEGVSDMPQTLSLVEQGRFALGYYHQRAWKDSVKAAVKDAGPSGVDVQDTAADLFSAAS